MAIKFNPFKMNTAPGPGVSKEEAEKRGFFKFFEIFFHNFWRLISLSVIFLAFCIPVVTIGAALSANSYVLKNIVAGDYVQVFPDFLKGMKKNWLWGTVIFILSLAVTAVMYIGLPTYYVQHNLFGYIGIAVMGAGAVVCFFMLYYIYTLQSCFHIKFKSLIKNSAIFATVCLLRNLFITLILAVIIYMFYVLMRTAIIFGSLFILLAVMFSGYFTSYMVYIPIKKYMIDPQTEAKDNGKDKIFEDTI